MRTFTKTIVIGAEKRQLMAGLKPGFLRFPGGNYLEGNTIDQRFEWKNTIGPISQRRGHESPWGYRSDDGLGMLEFLEWCEDLNMQPLLAVYAGYSLNGTHVNPGPDLQPYVQDALDEIQYITGPITTPWGAQRAADGHPAPFPLTYVEVGNEDFFDGSGSYDQRWATPPGSPVWNGTQIWSFWNRTLRCSSILTREQANGPLT